MDYVRQLRFEDQPDYAYARALFTDAAARRGFHDDGTFDWDVRGVGPGAPSGWASAAISRTSRAQLFGSVEFAPRSADFWF